MIDMEEKVFRENQMILERQCMEQERGERAKCNCDVNIHHEDDSDGTYDSDDIATNLVRIFPCEALFSMLAQDEEDDEEVEQEEIGILPRAGTRMEMEMESPPVLADMGSRPYDHGYARSNLFQIPVDGNHGTEQFPNRKPRTKTEPESHPVPPESAYAFIPNPNGGGFGDLMGAVLNSSNHVNSQRSAESDRESESASASGQSVDSEVDRTAVYQVGRDADSDLHVYKIGLETKEKDRERSVPKTHHVAKGSPCAPEFQQPKPYRSTPLQHTSVSEKVRRSMAIARTVRHANRVVEEHIVHPEDTRPYRVVIDNEGHIHRIQLASSKQSIDSKRGTIPHTQPSDPGRERSPTKPMRSERKVDKIVHPDDTHPYHVEIDNEGNAHLIHLDRPDTCNAAESSLYHRKLMEKEMRKHEYVVHEREKRSDSAATKATRRDPTSVTHATKHERFAKVSKPVQDDNHTPLGQMNENIKQDVFHHDNDVRYDVAQALVPEYYDDEPHPYEFVRGTDGNLHALEERPPDSNKAHDLNEVKKPTKANYRYAQDEDGTIHRLKLDDSMKNLDLHSPSLAAGLEDASDSDCENAFDDSKHTLRPRIGEWIEPGSEAELRKTERLRANNSN